MYWLDLKYIGFLSPRLDRFKITSNRPYKANCRCPYCGDSHKSKTKARGWILESDKGELYYYCHNCSISKPIRVFIKDQDETLYNEYVKEGLLSKYKEPEADSTQVFEEKMKPPKFIKYTNLTNLKKISQLPYNHPAKLYIVNRKIPNFYHSRLFYAPKFKEFTNSVLPGKYPSGIKDEARIIIPLIDKNKNLFGFQGRSLAASSDQKYITIIINPDIPRVFNLDRCDVSKPHIILEGPFDSMFIPNSVAMIGSALDKNFGNENSIIVLDNEPRSKDTCKRLKQYIDQGYQVSFFSQKNGFKDINAMVVGGIFPEVIAEELYQGACKGPEALLRFNKWKKI